MQEVVPNQLPQVDPDYRVPEEAYVFDDDYDHEVDENLSEPEPEPLIIPAQQVPESSIDDMDISAEVEAIDIAVYATLCRDRHRAIERDPLLNVGAGTSGAPVRGGPRRPPIDEGSDSD